MSRILFGYGREEHKEDFCKAGGYLFCSHLFFHDFGKTFLYTAACRVVFCRHLIGRMGPDAAVLGALPKSMPKRSLAKLEGRSCQGVRIPQAEGCYSRGSTPHRNGSIPADADRLRFAGIFPMAKSTFLLSTEEEHCAGGLAADGMPFSEAQRQSSAAGCQPKEGHICAAGRTGARPPDFLP